ncbi:MAG: amidohydrolase [Proteobacteria bacterium]|nr:amidohydrolase [Pseudomonadota bacterium]MYJ95003.1 amidohydrolase [Pseudomonadota bacterium]
MCVPASAADRIFLNGRIVTMDPNFTIVSALAVEGARVLATGDAAAMLALADTDSVVEDLDGQMMLPGLIDSHLHPDQASVSEFDHPIPAMLTVTDVMDYVRSRAQVLPEGEWIWVRTVLTPRLRERRYPTRAELDQAAPRHPVIFAPYIYYPKASLNSLALERLGIDREFESETPADIERDPTTGEPTGLVRNHTRYVDDPGEVDRTNDSERVEAVRNLMGIYNSVGLTTVSDRKATPISIKVYEELAAQDALTARLSLMHLLDTSPGRDVEEIVADILALGQLREQINHPMLDLIGVKTFIDGGITSGTAYMLEPWGESDRFAILDPLYRGNLVLSGDRLERLIRASANAGLQFTGHVVGDAAITELVRAYGAVIRETPIRHLRPSLTHANFIPEQVIGQMAEWGIVADIQPAWLYLDSNNLLDQWDENRLRHFQPLKSLFDAGVLVAGGSDHWHRLDSHSATNPFNPFLGMWITLKRVPRYVDRAVNEDQVLTREQALRLYTTNGAYLLFREEQVGSLEPGKYADMIVVDRDILESNLDDIRDTRVLRTYVNGELVYDAGSEQ